MRRIAMFIPRNARPNSSCASVMPGLPTSNIHSGAARTGCNCPLSCVAMTTFAELGLSQPILDALDDVGYQEPSPLQEQAIPHLLQGMDVIGQAQTGSGKTAAFGLPLINYVDPSEHEVQGLVLTPTR